jgi:hypothetical protein
LLVAVFGIAAFGKARSGAAFAEFADTLSDLPWIGARWRRPIAATVIAVETVTTALLILPWTASLGFASALLTLAVFTATVGVARARGSHVRCRCFGTGADADDAVRGASQLIRNAVLIAVAAAGLVSALAASSSATPAAGIAACSLGLIAGFVITRWDDLAFAFSF